MSDNAGGPATPFVSRGYPGFEGRVGRTFSGSEGWWPPQPTAPEGAPNVVIMLVDDLGFSDVGCFGGEIETPNLDRLAAEGLRFTDFHVTPMCSPTRAALLTGRNPHAAGVGHVAHSDAGFPGYAMELAPDTATIAELLRDHGYSTFMVGKWHLTKDSHQSDAGPRYSWPCQRGFDRFYGFLDAFTNLHHPHRLVEDNHPVGVDRYPDGYYLTDDLTDRAIDMIRATKAANPEKPFFLYFAHGAVHAPLHAKRADIERYADRYRGGWDALREQRHARQLDLGVFPLGTPLAPRNQEPGQEVPAWDELSADEQRLFARYMEVYAAMVDNIDQNLGRLRDAIEELGQWDDTVFLFTSDNGASREGEEHGTSSYFTHLLGHLDWTDDLERLDDLGGPRTMPHYPRGWAMLGNTPFRLYKINAHAGGHQVPCVVSWPQRLAAHAGQFRRRWAHVTDVLPTLLDLLGLEYPTERQGRELAPLAGTSFAAMFDDPAAETDHTDQYIECWGHRGYRRAPFEIVTLHQPLTAFGDHEWELFDLATDPVQLHDLAAERPEVVAELAAAWEEAAWANQVYPLEEGTYLKHVIRPPWDEVWRKPVTIARGTPTLERWRSQQLVWVRSFTATAPFTVAPGDQGMLLAHGDQGGGYALYVESGAGGSGAHLRFAHNDGHRMRTLDAGPIAPGEHEATLEVAAPGGNVWNIRLLVDGEERAAGDGFPLFLSIGPFEGIDVGIDRRSPVSWDLYAQHGPFPFTGELHHVHYEPGPYAPDAPFMLADMLRQIGLQFE
jgi:arylsulfatase